MKVICTERSQTLATQLAKGLKTEIVNVKFSRFPDGEQFLEAGELDDETIIVGSVVDSDSLVQLVLLVDACERSDSRLVVPYMAYARQDKKFKNGEPVSARAIARVLSNGVTDVTTVNIHDETILSHFSVPARNISIARDLGSWIQTLELTNPLILAPDDGAMAFAESVASSGGWECDHLEKTRLSGEKVTIAPKKVCVTDRPVVIVDDIISTGGTIATATGMLYRQGATDVYAACVHGVLSGGAYVRLISGGIRDVVCSNTIERGCSKISAANEIARSLRKS
jgi:ribose-phosphate pyrophosphokinase